MKLATHEMFKKELSKADGLRQISESDHLMLQKTLLEMIKDIDSLAQKCSIPYMLGGGTALGAVRHSGFIPWDDDVDINIERRYVNKLIKAIRKELPDKYEVIVPGENKEYESVFIQIQKKGTIYRENLSLPDELSGIKIDVFVLENTFDNKALRLLHGLMTNAWLFLMSCIRFYERRDEFTGLAGNSIKIKAVVAIKSAIGKIFAGSKDKVYSDLLKIIRACRDDKSKYVTFPSGRGHFFGELTRREPFASTKRVPFEDTALPVTVDSDNYLKRLFGDYMTMPGEAGRERHMLYDLKF